MTVFVLHRTNHDLSPAKSFGELRFVLHGHIFADEIDDGQIPPEYKNRMWAAAQEFNVQTDFFLLVGDQLQIALFTAMVVSLNETEFRVLRYDQEAKGYFAVRISV